MNTREKRNAEHLAARLMLASADELNNAADRILALEKENAHMLQVFTEMNDYLYDRHPQGSKDARAINTISTGSIFHQNIIQIINHYSK